MKYLLIFTLVFICGCGVDKAALMKSIIDDCEEGQTLSFGYSAGTLTDHVNITCTWVVKAKEPA